MAVEETGQAEATPEQIDEQEGGVMVTQEDGTQVLAESYIVLAFEGRKSTDFRHQSKDVSALQMVAAGEWLRNRGIFQLQQQWYKEEVQRQRVEAERAQLRQELGRGLGGKLVVPQ